MEIWKSIKDYEGLYEVSNYGRVKSLSRLMFNGRCNFLSKERILKQGLNDRLYLHVVLCKEGKLKTRTVHQLVAESFLNHKPDGTQTLVVDHINGIKTDNSLENIQIITQRENSSKSIRKVSSKYTGVSWHTPLKKWYSCISLNGKTKYLGVYNSEIEASNAYKKALFDII